MENKRKINIIIIAVLLIVVLAIYIGFKKSETISDNLVVPTQTSQNEASSTTVQPKTTAKTATKTQSDLYLAKDGVYVVLYTDSGFAPRNLQIPRGKSVRFVNASTKGLMIYTTDNDPKFVELNQAKTIGKGEVYSFSFTTAGLWSYQNKLEPKHTASILVY
jgi:plastocyanin